MGFIADPTQSAIYEMLVDNNAIIEESEEEDTDASDDEFKIR